MPDTRYQQEDTDIFRIGRDMPGSNRAVYFRDPDGHPIEISYGMEQSGWDGRPRFASERRPVTADWTETVDVLCDPYANRLFQDLLG